MKKIIPTNLRVLAKKSLTMLAVAAVLFCACDGRAGVTLFSDGFETGNLNNWTGSAGNVGVYAPGGQGRYTSYNSGVNGTYMAQLYNDSAASGYIYVNVGSLNLTTGANIELTVTVGFPGPNGYIDHLGTPTIALEENPTGGYNTGTSPTITSSSEVLPVQNAMSTWTIDYTLTSDATSLQIILADNFGGVNGSVGPSQVNFDNVSLVTVVPEPVNVALAVFGLIAVGGLAVRRLVASRKNALQLESARQ